MKTKVRAMLMISFVDKGDRIDLTNFCKILKINLETVYGARQVSIQIPMEFHEPIREESDGQTTTQRPNYQNLTPEDLG